MVNIEKEGTTFSDMRAVVDGFRSGCNPNRPVLRVWEVNFVGVDPILVYVPWTAEWSKSDPFY